MKSDLDLTPEEAIRLAAIVGFELDASNEDLRTITPQVWAAIEAFNIPPVIFRHGDGIVRLEQTDDGGIVLSSMTLDRMRHLLARSVNWYRVGRGKEPQRKIALPPIAVVRDVLATPTPALPHLLSISHCPTFDREGRLHQEAGYCPITRTYHAPAFGFTIPDVSAAPTMDEIRFARETVLEVVEDFPFVGEAERAHAIALGLLLFVRNVIDGSTPLHVIEKPSPGTGGSLLVDALTYPATGQLSTAITEAKDDDEWRKRITSVLRRSPAVVLIDNINRELSSSALAGVLTLTIWEDRVLGKSETLRLPNHAAWVATGNNMVITEEITRRSIRCRLDAKTDQPWVGRTFRKPNLRDWIAQNRGKVVWAYLTLCQAWINAGQPRWSGSKLGGFESWSEVIGGLLDFIEVPGFLANLSQFYAETDTEGSLWRGLLETWWSRYQGREIGTAEVYRLIRNGDFCIGLGNGDQNSQKTRLGKLLGAMRDRQFAQLRLTAGGKKQGAQQWSLVQIP